jgi:protein dithiol:quinone oxidoreductase
LAIIASKLAPTKIVRMPKRRIVYLLGFAICASLIGFALYLQHVLAEDPCPLCILQRIAVVALGAVFFVAAVHNPRRRGVGIYSLLLLVVAGIGTAIAGRHVWLQHLPPDKVPECGPGLGYLLDTNPLGKALALVFKGSGECAQVGWKFLNLSIPEWTLIWFIVLGIVGFAQIWNREH